MKDFFKPSDCDIDRGSVAVDHTGKTLWTRPAISLSKANRLHAEWLAKAPDVLVQLKNIDGGLTKDKYYVATQIPNCGETSRAKLVNIEPIEVDSERKVLADLVEMKNNIAEVEYVDNWYGTKGVFDIIERARKLLEGK